jgi:hypothetical protein
MAKKIKKSQTLAEFKAWLQGITEIQPANWAPDAAQWRMIKDRIDNIIEQEFQPVQTQTIPTGPMYRAPVATSGLPIPSSLGGPEQQVEELPRRRRQAAPPMVTVPEQKIKTPDIDTSNGGYDSSFA